MRGKARVKVARNIAAAVFIALISLAAAGCYSVEQEVISYDMAAPLPVRMGKHGDMGILPVPYSNDYRFGKINSRGGLDTGTIRAVRLVRDIYLVQVKYDGKDAYLMVFYRINSPESFRALIPDEKLTEKLAEKHGITVNKEGNITSSREKILSFLLAHEGLPEDAWK